MSPGVAGEGVLAHPAPVLPSEHVLQVACQQMKQLFDHTGTECLLHQELGIPLDIWTFWVGMPASGQEAAGAVGQRAQSLLLFKRLVH